MSLSLRYAVVFDYIGTDGGGGDDNGNGNDGDSADNKKSAHLRAATQLAW